MALQALQAPRDESCRTPTCLRTVVLSDNLTGQKILLFWGFDGPQGRKYLI